MGGSFNERIGDVWKASRTRRHSASDTDNNQKTVALINRSHGTSWPSTRKHLVNELTTKKMNPNFFPPKTWPNVPAPHVRVECTFSSSKTWRRVIPFVFLSGRRSVFVRSWFISQSSTQKEAKTWRRWHLSPIAPRWLFSGPNSSAI